MLHDTCTECGKTKPEDEMMPEGNEAGQPVCVECWVGGDIYE